MSPDDPVADALARHPREGFLRVSDRRRASYDGPISIGCGQTSSQPRTVAAMLRLLAVRRGDRVLDVGAGSGWTTALLAHLTGPTGTVVGVELLPDLAAWGAGNLAATDQPWARLRLADPERRGWPAAAPYDRILVSAGPDRLPRALVDQLADPGVLVVPVAGVMLRVAVENGVETVAEHGHFRFVPLR